MGRRQRWVGAAGSWAVGVAVWSMVSTASAGKLESVRSEVRESSSSGSSSSGSSSSSSSWSPDGSSSGDGEASSFNWDLDHAPRYPRFPYRGASNGYVRRMDTPEERAEGDDTRTFAGTVQAEGAYLYDKVYRAGFALDVNYYRLGFKSDLSFFLEGPLKDALYLGSSNLQVAFIMLPRLRWRAGGGAQYMIDGRLPGQGHREYAAGYNFTTDVDIFPFWPVVLSTRLDYGRIYKAPSVLARSTLGLVLQGFELYGGYEYRQVGRVVLHGPTAGLRVWF